MASFTVFTSNGQRIKISPVDVKSPSSIFAKSVPHFQPVLSNTDCSLGVSSKVSEGKSQYMHNMTFIY